MNRLIIPAVTLATAVGLAACASPTISKPDAAATTPLPGYTATPTPAPQPSPSGKIAGSCDVSLSSSLYGQNYLTAQVTATNTGNIGTFVRIRVSWPLQGFSPIHDSKTVRLQAGHSKNVEFHEPVGDNTVSQFQDAQLATTGDPCNYRADITGTFGQARN